MAKHGAKSAKSTKRDIAPPAPESAEGDTAVDLTMLDNLIGYNLRRAHGVQIQRFTSVFGPLNVRPVQFSILGLIHHNPELKQSELGRALNIERANIVNLLAELEDRGLVTRRTTQADRRSRVLHLTPAGRKLTLKLLDLHARLERNLEEHLGGRERDQLLKLLAAFRRLDPAPDLGDD